MYHRVYLSALLPTRPPNGQEGCIQHMSRPDGPLLGLHSVVTHLVFAFVRAPRTDAADCLRWIVLYYCASYKAHHAAPFTDSNMATVK